MDFFTKRDGVLQLRDGNGDLIFDFDDEGVMIGNFTMDGLEESQRASVPVKNRGVHVGDVPGDDTEITGGFDIRLKRESFTHATNARSLDALLATGSFASPVNDNPIATGPVQHQLWSNYGAGTAIAKLRRTRVTVSSIKEDGDTVTASISYVSHRIERV